MRYAFLALVVVYLITFFGCSPEEQETSHKPAATAHQQPTEKKVTPPVEQKEEKQQAEQKYQKASEQTPAQIETQTEKQLADNWNKVADAATENVLEIIVEEEDTKAANKEEKNDAEPVKDKEKENNAALHQAIEQMDDAASELIELSSLLLIENQRLKKMLTTLIECPVVQKGANCATAAETPEENGQEKKEQPAQEKKPATQSLKEAIDAVEDSAHQVASDVASKTREVLAEQSEKAKKVAKELTEKAVDATNTALDNAKKILDETGKTINKELATPKNDAEQL